ncbi:hypothetical protein B0H94_10542 [Salsuginibacillus halophilus]|uniref:Uncharacterized protein n=1 Tax=Salsuginibacillus halophilus TaxID=517424 RepID=A0A2P8HL01_9BACI|nr:hypothetical protein B0H94_10542 [Salsuginibacillus halophilus]
MRFILGIVRSVNKALQQKKSYDKNFYTVE